MLECINGQRKGAGPCELSPFELSALAKNTSADSLLATFVKQERPNERSKLPYCRSVSESVSSRSIRCSSQSIEKTPADTGPLSEQMNSTSPSNLVSTRNVSKLEGHHTSKLEDKHTSISNCHHAKECFIFLHRPMISVKTHLSQDIALFLGRVTTRYLNPSATEQPGHFHKENSQPASGLLRELRFQIVAQGMPEVDISLEGTTNTRGVVLALIRQDLPRLPVGHLSVQFTLRGSRTTSSSTEISLFAPMKRCPLQSHAFKNNRENILRLMGTESLFDGIRFSSSLFFSLVCYLSPLCESPDRKLA